MKFFISVICCVLLLASCGNSGKRQDNKETANSDTTKAIEKPDNDCHDDFIATIGDNSFTELGLACREGNINAIKRLVNKGACKNRCMADEIYEYDALYTSIEFERIEAVKYFVESGDDVNRIYDESGMSALCLACFGQNKELACDIARILLNAGAKVNGNKSIDGSYMQIPLRTAVLKDNKRLAKLLLDKGADPKMKDEQGEDVYSIINNWNWSDTLAMESSIPLNEANLLCGHENLSDKFSFYVYSANDDEENPKVVNIVIQNKETSAKQELEHELNYISNLDLICKGISYFNKNKEIDEGLESFHGFIVADYNFDKLEDFAILYDTGGNGGPWFSYYLQNENGYFYLPDSFPLNPSSYFPVEINAENKTLKLQHPAGATKISTTVFQLNNGVWDIILSEQTEITD